MHHSNIFVISAPSGAGKSSLVKALCQLDPKIQKSISHTTRKMRPGELDGVDYFFIDKDKFHTMLTGHEFLEHAQVYDNYYGTNIKTIQQFLATGQDIILEIDHQGAQQIKNAMPEAILIYIMPPSIEELERRLKIRNTDNISTIEKRLNAATEDMKYSKWFEHIIVNDDFNSALHQLYSIIRVNRTKLN